MMPDTFVSTLEVRLDAGSFCIVLMFQTISFGFGSNPLGIVHVSRDRLRPARALSSALLESEPDQFSLATKFSNRICVRVGSCGACSLCSRVRRNSQRGYSSTP